MWQTTPFNLTDGGSGPRLILSKWPELRVYSAERVVGDFEHAIRLSEFVDGENILAEFKHSVLFLTVPNVQAAQARKIAIKGVENGPINP